MKSKEAAKNALENIIEAKPGESVLIITDDIKREVAQAFAEGALEIGLWTRINVLKTEHNVFRTEPPAHLVEMINLHNPPDIFINLFRGGAKETIFRIKIMELEARKGRSRVGHCPGITLDMLTEGALALTKDQTIEMQNNARNLLAILQETETVHITAPGGSDFTFSVKGRTWFSDTFINWKTRKNMNLPTGEVLIGPVETSMQGILVCDLAVGGIGPIEHPIIIEVIDGHVEKVSSEDKKALKIIEETQATDKMAKHIGEFAFGLNPRARIVEEFLESEKVSNTIHVAFGANLSYPGVVANYSKTHQDFLVDKPTAEITFSDGHKTIVMENGTLQI
ncbi:MAG: aminopeptidase [Promethearchaeota archaeon]